MEDASLQERLQATIPDGRPETWLQVAIQDKRAYLRVERATWFFDVADPSFSFRAESSRAATFVPLP